MRLLQQRINHYGFELVPFVPDDCQLYVQLVSSPQVMQYIGPTISEQKAEAMFQQVLALEVQCNYYYWSVTNPCRDKVGLAALITEEQGVAEFGLMLLPEYCFQGYSVPVLSGLINFAFRQWQLDKVFAKHLSINLAAPGLLRRLSVDRVNDEGDYWFWHLERSRWAELNAKPPYINVKGN